MDIEKTIRGYDLFRSLNVNEMNDVSKYSSTKSFKKGENIFDFNGASSHVYMLLEGTVYLRLPGKMPDFSLIISHIHKGELFGLSPLLDSPRYTATAQCAEDTKALSIEAKPFRELLKKNYPVGFDIINQVARIYYNRYIHVLKNLQDIVDQIPLIR
ncbi:MAG: cyclic nucleotide-binding domain-containing protein [candidate division Zixibacteria bacterium]|nr:cyclic nucleotide-binding domain-containing protein [candidate division Zixibacteria bacterium]